MYLSTNGHFFIILNILINALCIYGIIYGIMDSRTLCRPTHLGTDIGFCPKSSNIKVTSPTLLVTQGLSENSVVWTWAWACWFSGKREVVLCIFKLVAQQNTHMSSYIPRNRSRGLDSWNAVMLDSSQGPLCWNTHTLFLSRLVLKRFLSVFALSHCVFTQW